MERDKTQYIGRYNPINGYCRNLAVFETAPTDVVRVAVGFVRLVHDYNKYAGEVFNKGLVGTASSPSSWIPPPADFVKVNFDAHLYADGGVCCGVVIRDWRGCVVAAGAKRWAGRWSVEMAEARAALYGVQMARRLHFRKVMLEGDSLSVCNAIAKHGVGEAPIFLWFDEIRFLSSSFDVFSCSHVRRSGNCVAHLVARWEVAPNDEVYLSNDFPQGLLALVELDLC